MSATLNVNGKTCIRCEKCVKVCPSSIFVQSAPAEEVTVENETMCIGCGHCVAVCPTSSVVHHMFPPEKVHHIDYDKLPSPEQVMLLCKARRSNRSFLKKPVPAGSLDMILEAAHIAPTASNMQQVSFTVVNDPEKLLCICDYTIGVFEKMMRPLKNPLLKPLLKRIMPGNYRYIPVFERIKQERAAGNNMVTRNATSVIFIHTPVESRFGFADCNLAYQNGSLMAQSLGVSQVYMGFVLTAVKSDKNTALIKELGIDGTVHAIMGLGMPAFNYPNYIDRKPIEVKTL